MNPDTNKLERLMLRQAAEVTAAVRCDINTATRMCRRCGVAVPNGVDLDDVDEACSRPPVDVTDKYTQEVRGEFPPSAAAMRTSLEGMRSALQSAPPGELLRPDGSPVPKHWAVFKVGEHVVLKDYTFKVAYMNEGSLMLEPVGPVLLKAETVTE